jgi:hypothetical protein
VLLLLLKGRLRQLLCWGLVCCTLADSYQRTVQLTDHFDINAH